MREAPAAHRCAEVSLAWKGFAHRHHRCCSRWQMPLFAIVISPLHVSGHDLENIRASGQANKLLCSKRHGRLAVTGYEPIEITQTL